MDKQIGSSKETKVLSVNDAVVFTGKVKEVYYVSSIDEEREDGTTLVCIVNDEGSDCGTYYPSELVKVPSVFIDKIKELEAKIKELEARQGDKIQPEVK